MTFNVETDQFLNDPSLWRTKHAVAKDTDGIQKRKSKKSTISSTSDQKCNMVKVNEEEYVAEACKTKEQRTSPPILTDITTRSDQMMNLSINDKSLPNKKNSRKERRERSTFTDANNNETGKDKPTKCRQQGRLVQHRRERSTFTDANNNETAKDKPTKCRQQGRLVQHRFPCQSKEVPEIGAEEGQLDTVQQNSSHESTTDQQTDSTNVLQNKIDVDPSSVTPKNRRKVRRKFLGRTIKHKWTNSRGKDKWYEGYVQALLTGEDGDISAKYIVRYSGFDDLYEVEGLAEDYDKALLKFMDI